MKNSRDRIGVEQRTQKAIASPSRAGAVLVSDDPQAERAVRATLESYDDLSMVGVCRSWAELAADLKRRPTAVAIVDIDPDPRRALPELAKIVRRFPDTRFVVLSNSLTSELIIESMEIGARSFLNKQRIESDLPGVLQRLAQTGQLPAAQYRGRLITVFSAGGGCGATTIAVNLANELQLAASERTLLIDMDRAYGAAGIYLGLSGRYSVADVLSRQGVIDFELIRSTAQSYGDPDGLEVLLSPTTVTLPDFSPPDYRRLEELLEACRQGYAFTVFDAPRVPVDVSIRLAGASDATLLVLQLTVKDIRVSRTMLTNLTEGGVGAEHIFPVVNRHGSKEVVVGLQEGKTVLDGFDLWHVQNDFENAMRSFDYGQPLSQCAPRSRLRRDIQQLAMQVARVPALQGKA